MEQERRDLASKFDQLRHRQAQKLAFRQAQAVRLEQMQSRAQTLGQEIEGLREARELQTQELDESRTRRLSREPIAPDLRDKRAEMKQTLQRSEARRVGEGCGRTCYTRWSPYHEKKKIK